MWLCHGNRRMPEQTGATELKPNVHHSRQRRTEDLIKPPAPLLEPSASALFSSPISVFREKRQSENQPPTPSDSCRHKCISCSSGERPCALTRQRRNNTPDNTVMCGERLTAERVMHHQPERIKVDVDLISDSEFKLVCWLHDRDP